MSEQKYYVKLNQDVKYYSQDYEWHESINYIETWLDKYFDFAPESDRATFTKSELSKIMDGALYKQSDCLPFEWLYSLEQLRNEFGWEYNESIDKWEWKNPLIELVPVDEVIE